MVRGIDAQLFNPLSNLDVPLLIEEYNAERNQDEDDETVKSIERMFEEKRPQNFDIF